MTQSTTRLKRRSSVFLKHVFRNKPRYLLIGLWLLVGLAACEDASPGDEAASDAEAGPFEAKVDGALQATLQGEATARVDTAGRLTGLELNDANDTTRAGLSFELAARPLGGRRTYTVSPRRSAPGDTGRVALMNTYLRLRGHQFAARAGSLRVRRDSSGVHGTFDLRLRGVVEAASDEPATVIVRGRFDGVRPPRP